MIRVVRNMVAREAVHAALVARGYAPTRVNPLQHGRETSAWSRRGDHVTFVTSGSCGAAFFVATGPEEASLLAELDAIVPTASAAEVVSRREATAGARARHLLVVSELTRFMRFDAELTRASLVRPVIEALLAEEAPLRGAAVRAAQQMPWKELDPTFERLAELRPDLAWLARAWTGVRKGEDARVAQDAAAEARLERRRSLGLLVSESRFDEALSLSIAVFEESKKVPLEAWRARALSLVGLGRSWEGALFTAAWRNKTEDSSPERAEADAALEVAARGCPDDAQDLAPLVLDMVALLEDGAELASALSPLVALSPHRHEELAFAATALRLRDDYSRERRAEALPLVERTLARYPQYAEAHALKADCLVARGDKPLAEASLRRALELSEREPVGVPASLLALGHALSSTPARERVFRRLLGLYTSGEGEAHDRLRLTSELAARAAELGPDLLRDTLLARALAATAAREHVLAIEAYRAAMAKEDGKPSDLVRFNLACELAKQGHRDEALATLREAIELDDTWAEKARTDDYFAPIWDDREFVLLTAGLDEVPAHEDVAERIQSARQAAYGDDGEEALEEAFVAYASAEALRDNALAAEALTILGTARTFFGRAEDAVRTLEKAAARADEALRSAPELRANAHHALGVALHAAGRLDDAERAYLEALAQRQASVGPSDFAVGNSLGDMARLASARGRHAEADDLMKRALGVFDALVVEKEGPARWDPLVNAALTAGNIAASAFELGLSYADALSRATEAVDRFEAVVRANVRLSQAAIVRMKRVLARLCEELGQGEDAALFALLERLFMLEVPDPRARAELRYWRGLRVAVRGLLAQGADEKEIAHAIGRAVRGQPAGEPLASAPAFANLSGEFAARLSSPGDLVLVAMALEMATTGAQSVDKMLADFESIAVAAATGARDELDEELDDEELDEDDLDDEDLDDEE